MKQKLLATIRHSPTQKMPRAFFVRFLGNIKHQTSNIKHQTSNIKHQTSNIKHQTSNNYKYILTNRVNYTTVGNKFNAIIFSHLENCPCKDFS